MVFKPGISGNPLGRPKGSKNRLSEKTYEELANDFQEHGADAIRIVRMTEPASYLRFVASVLPKEMELAVHAHQVGGIDPEDMPILIELLKAAKEALPNINQRQPGEVMRTMTDALRLFSAISVRSVCITGSENLNIGKDSGIVTVSTDSKSEDAEN
jgi:hypothetical protein